MAASCGSLSPGIKWRSTPSSVMTAMRMVPPDEPSRRMARLSAVGERGPRTVLDKLERLVLVPARPPVGVAEAVDVRRPRAADGPRLLKHAAAERNVEHAAAVQFVPAGDNDACAEPVLVLVYQLLEQIRRDVGRRLHFLRDRVELQVVGDHVRERLRVGRRARAAAVDAVREVRELVGDAVCLGQLRCDAQCMLPSSCASRRQSPRRRQTPRP